MTIWAEIEAEAAAAWDRYGDYTSTHEALGVLVEEMDELRAAIRTNYFPDIAREAKQVAAVAGRLFAACRLAERGQHEAFRERSGCGEYK